MKNCLCWIICRGHVNIRERDVNLLLLLATSHANNIKSRERLTTWTTLPWLSSMREALKWTLWGAFEVHILHSNVFRLNSIGSYRNWAQFHKVRNGKVFLSFVNLTSVKWFSNVSICMDFAQTRIAFGTFSKFWRKFFRFSSQKCLEKGLIWSKIVL